MLGLAPFSGAPISGFLVFSPVSSVSGLQADAILGSVTATPTTITSITGVSGTAILNIGFNGRTYPVKWSVVPTAQYPEG